MSLFPADMPRPQPDMDDEGFWAQCAARKLCFQGCAACGKLRHPPTPICWNCHSVEVKWVEAQGNASLFTYTVVHHASHTAVAGSLPFVGAVVAFASSPGVKLVSNIIDVDPADLAIGMPLKLVWDDIGEGMYIYRFKPAET
jgi:uncharacterized protein